MVNIDAVEENLEVFVNVVAVEEDTVEEVFVNVVASATAEEDTGVTNLTSNNNSLIDPNKMKVKELKAWLTDRNLCSKGTKPILVNRVIKALKTKNFLKITFVDDDDVHVITDSLFNTRKRKTSEDSFEQMTKNLEEVLELQKSLKILQWNRQWEKPQ